MRHHWILCANFFLIIIIITRIQLLYKTMLAELIKIKINYWQHDREGGGGATLEMKNLKSLHVQIQIGKLLVPVPRTLSLWLASSAHLPALTFQSKYEIGVVFYVKLQ